MKCEDVSITKIEKWGKTPEGRNVKYWDVIHKKKCSNELHNLKEDENIEEQDNVEEENKDTKESVEEQSVADSDNDSIKSDKEMTSIKEHFSRFMKK